MNKKLNLAALCFSLIALQANAGVLTYDGTLEISNGSDANLNFDVSVVDGAAGYVGGVNSGTFGDGSILDYRFFNNSGTVFNDAGYANGGNGIVGTATATNSSTLLGGALNWADLWTSGDINSDPADFTTDTMARSQGVTGSLNISQLQSGTLDFITGTYISSYTIALVMSGSGQADVLASFTSGNFSSINRSFDSTFSFSDAALYDSISYTYTNTDTDGSRARFMGAVVDGVAVPEPASIALLALGLFGLGISRVKKAA